MRSLSALLLSLALCGTAQAAVTAEAETAFDNALRMADANQQRLEQLIDQEQQGHLDKQVLLDTMAVLTQSIQAYEAELRKASDGGHAVATYLLGNLQESRKHFAAKDATASHAQACALYQTATDQGLLAGAVTLLRECETASRRFKFDDPELLRLQRQLLKALQQPDAFADHYPLPALNSLCFKELKVPVINGERPLSTLADAYTPTVLDFDQFRADGYYLLAFKGEVDGEAARGYFKKVQALTPDCLDPMRLSGMYKATDSDAR
ncbi:putative secreted protein [Pseudomonas reidholzensis]|uniref:Putative secreted protein n=1 Tax=Pseudomonas reidholzensis TaxID=1785162 RepID=A0A383RU19_9PSED|nr:hypothetical protein [Pseudomonas reidholzensis]SYX90539.1 putative secreted protein [Pseudomonas reidholzensis]